jgi:hypothetical protein
MVILPYFLSSGESSELTNFLAGSVVYGCHHVFGSIVFFGQDLPRKTYIVRWCPRKPVHFFTS